MAEFKQKRASENPFKPGYGLAPPLLAGRGEEQAIFSARFEGLAAGEAQRGIALYGPRGMGKTALLNWAAEECKRSAAGKGARELCVIQVAAPKLLAKRESVLNTLTQDTAMRVQTETSLMAGAPGLAKGGRAWTDIAIDRRWDDLEATLINRCKASPMALLLDEAHAISRVDGGIYQQFLNIVQDVAAKSPFLLALAGTPDLPDALDAIDATFIDRAEEIGLGLLDMEEAKRALGKPLAADGIQIDADALSFAAEDGQRYPYFLQLWGKCLWDQAMQDGKGRLAMGDAEAAGRGVQKEKTNYYAKRYAELAKSDLARLAAGAVAGAFQGADACNEDRLASIVKDALLPQLPSGDLTGAVQAQFKTMRRLGFIWRDPAEDLIRPGIPSLMEYTLGRINPGA